MKVPVSHEAFSFLKFIITLTWILLHIRYPCFRKALITGWGYTETTKALTPRPKTSDVLREAEVFILPQVLFNFKFVRISLSFIL